MNSKQKHKPPKWFYLILIAIPIIFILLLEVTLRIVDYGIDMEQWVELTDEKIILNPEIGARYFSNIENFPHSNHDAFDKIKSENSFRVFVLGGSSTAGFPYQPNGSFSRYLRDRLKLTYPSKQIEIINLGITAVNSITIRDLIPGIIDKSPDLVIIYAGHNEYYGALGVGSTQSIGNTDLIIQLYLFSQQFKTTQLLSDVVSSIAGFLFSEDSNTSSGTLMARMADDKSIQLNSDRYIDGFNQFKENLEYILSKLIKAGIPTVIGTLTSNILDQKPFYSFNDSNSFSADHHYQLGLNLFDEGDIDKADSNLILAKDLDGLRFRAPSEFNEAIIDLGIRFRCEIVDINGKFRESSKHNIVGNDLMVDHLHPTLDGQFIIGEAFFNEIISMELLPEPEVILTLTEQDSIVKANFAFSSLDSITAELRILNLLNDWPFVPEKIHDILSTVNLNTAIDSLAYKIVKNNYNWESAHQEAYKYYLQAEQIEKFIDEINVLVAQYPYKLTYYNFAAQELIKRKYYDEAAKFLKMRYELKPDAFSTKWLGNIALFNKEYKNALRFLNESIKFTENDSQSYFNLSIAFLNLGEFDSALEAVKVSLKLDPNNDKAKALLTELNKKAGN